MWLSLKNIKMGSLHLAITIVEDNGKVISASYWYLSIFNKAKHSDKNRVQKKMKNSMWGNKWLQCFFDVWLVFVSFISILNFICTGS